MARVPGLPHPFTLNIFLVCTSVDMRLRSSRVFIFTPLDSMTSKVHVSANFL